MRTLKILLIDFTVHLSKAFVKLQLFQKTLYFLSFFTYLKKCIDSKNTLRVRKILQKIFIIYKGQEIA